MTPKGLKYRICHYKNHAARFQSDAQHGRGGASLLIAGTVYSVYLLRGKGGVPWVQIMENELEYLADRGGHGGHLGEKFVKKYCS